MAENYNTEPATEKFSCEKPTDEEVIASLFENYNFNGIIAKICEVDTDPKPKFRAISQYAQKLYLNPNLERFGEDELREQIHKFHVKPDSVDTMAYDELINWGNVAIRSWCEVVLERMIIFANNLMIYHSCLLMDLSKCEIDFVRLQCCAKTDFFYLFLDDPNERVAKVAKIRWNFRQKLQTLPEDDIEMKRLKFLTNALKKEEIKFWFEDTTSDDRVQVAIDGKWISSGYIECDMDVFRTISDVSICADTLNELLKTGQIKFKDDCIYVPDYFKGRQFY